MDRSNETKTFAPFAVQDTGLVRVDQDNLDHALFLYRLLEQRTPDQAISHRAMPSFSEHVEFVRKRPYLVWYMIRAGGETVGAIYLTRQNEIGLHILAEHQRKGHGGWAVQELMKIMGGPGEDDFLANINPNNAASIAFWESLGFELRQVTYAHPAHRS